MKIKESLQNFFIYDEKNPDLVISIGGDGTILEAVHQYLNVDCCFVGIHTGTLGFYTDYQIEINKKDSFQTYYALNELRLDQGLQAQVIHVYIGNVLLEVFRGNGLCVSTPSGSTAYNKSLGGSIIYPGIPLMQLTEVAGIPIGRKYVRFIEYKEMSFIKRVRRAFINS